MIVKHWYDFGGLLALATAFFVLAHLRTLSSLRLLLLISFISLLLHQLEEYRFPGYFPHMLNKTLFHSKNPERFPLNPQSAFIINVCMGWSVYLLAVLFAEKALWLAIASLMISVGNIIAHTLLFNLKGKTFYNPGMATALLLFLPISIYFFWYIQQHHLSSPMDYGVGIVLGIFLNYFGVIQLIDILKNKHTPYSFHK